MKKILALTVLALLLAASSALAQGALGTTAPTATVTVNVATEAALTIQTAALTLNQTGSNFADYTGTTNFTYFIRTAKTGGVGSIVLEVTGDFSAGGGSSPSVKSPPTSTDFLYYSCTVPSPTSGTATACTGPVNSSTTASTSVATFGTDARSPKAGVSSSVLWGLSNDPLYQTGSYTATVTYTISAVS
ncbi:MAG: hypothetical protein ABSE93_17000 [Terriglobia bacterium]|jgi:hypothetical protein